LAGPVWELGIPALGQAVFEGTGVAEAQGPFSMFPKN
jgi:hypothetical protein